MDDPINQTSSGYTGERIDEITWKAENKGYPTGIILISVSTAVFVLFLLFVGIRHKGDRVWMRISIPIIGFFFSGFCLVRFGFPLYDDVPVWAYVGLCGAPIAIVGYTILACLSKVLKLGRKKSAPRQQWYGLDTRSTQPEHDLTQGTTSTNAQHDASAYV